MAKEVQIDPARSCSAFSAAEKSAVKFFGRFKVCYRKRQVKGLKRVRHQPIPSQSRGRK